MDVQETADGTARPAASRIEARWRLVGRIGLAAAFVVMAATVRDYGITWDEEHSSTNGKYWIDWYRSGFTARGAIEDNNQRLYGSFFNGLSRLVSERSPLGLYETGHVLTALFGWVALWAAWRLGTRLAGPRAGCLAMVMLALTPGWYGQTFNNPKDVPFAVLFLLALGAMVSLYPSLPKPRLAQMLTVGAVIGFAFGVRVGAIVLLGCYALLYACWVAARLRSRDGYLVRSPVRDLLTFGMSWLGVAAIAWAVMLPWWPYAQLGPWMNVRDALHETGHFFWKGVVLYDGSFVRASALPRTYLPRWFAQTLPEFYPVIFLGAACAFVLNRVRARLRSPNLDLQSQVTFLTIAMLGLPVAAVATKAVLYDAYRHFLFVLPLLAVLAGCTTSWLLDQPWYRLKVITVAVAGALAVLTAADMVALHPYESIYFNRVSGGLKHAFGRYETDYWGASHKEGLDWLAGHYRVGAPNRSVRVANTAYDALTKYYIVSGGERLRRFVAVGAVDAPDVILSITRWDLHKKYEGRVLHVVERMNVPLLYVIEMTTPGPSGRNHREPGGTGLPISGDGTDLQVRTGQAEGPPLGPS